MALRTLHHHDRHGAAGVMSHPRAYEMTSAIGFLGARREVFTRLAIQARPRPGERFLDVGCGTGYLTRVVAPVVGPAGRVTGIDPSPEMIGYARGRAPGNCDYLVGEGQSLPFPDESFDAVVSSLAVHHIPEDARQAAIREMARVLRPDGRLLVAEYRPPARPLARRLAELVGGPALHGDPYGMLRTLLPEAGLRIEAEGDLPVMLSYVRARKPS
ncbi:methyltransferase domain-containing protein [Nonomuraea sp. MCN248]|uniref:Methyltransferase domain-containing protein n=1 Tax=Nonomuraea corallina TaxID=2989783 RepID=A0ABT4SJK6_9ACTN|nr:methyltransferase domain-containing protein [Nonomuraea corallina]MDA0637407.1 methyltransferase domain-containing protein [Nonomuraea corallina]